MLMDLILLKFMYKKFVFTELWFVFHSIKRIPMEKTLRTGYINSRNPESRSYMLTSLNKSKHFLYTLKIHIVFILCKLLVEIELKFQKVDKLKHLRNLVDS